MMYTILIEETLSTNAEIEANSPEEAEEIVRKMYRDCEIVLDASDFSCVLIREENTCK